MIWDPIKVLTFLDFADETDHTLADLLPPSRGLVSLGEVPTKVISVKSMTIYLKIPHYFYTDINFQRPISHLILIWDPLNFYHFCTLQIKLSNFDRSIPLSLLLPPLSNKQKLVYIPYFCEIYGHLFKSSLLFLYKFKFSEACILLNIDLAPIKDPSFMHFADQTEQL